MINVNSRTYTLPEKPVVFICLDGTSPEYLAAARDVMPNLERIRTEGEAGVAQSVIPSFTNPNNLALVTGVPPSVNGICGNFYFDRDREEEVMMNDPRFLRCQTVLAVMSQIGKSVAVITAKEKLRKLLGKDLKGICFSVERAHEVTEDENGLSDVVESLGRVNPGVYHPECSVYCLEAGHWLLRERRPDFLYLSTTDFVQHKYEPDSLEARSFYQSLDHFIGLIDQEDVILGITADHGMNGKTRADGPPQVRFLESILTENGVSDARVILPITDPYVVHHGALGSFATIYLKKDSVETALRILRAVDGVEEVLTRREAVERFALPGDRIGDLVVLGDRGTVLGRTPEWHDLSSVEQGLRSHGGLHEREVPLIVNRKLRADYRQKLLSGTANNYDLLDLLCNGVIAYEYSH